MPASVERYLNVQPSYPEVGGTRTGEIPPGYRPLRERFLIGRGELALRAAAEAILSFEMHRAAGMRLTASGPRAVAGVTIVGMIGYSPLRMTVPCRVIWALEVGAGLPGAGFAYGTLPGHPERGEESFAVSLTDDGEVWLAIDSFSQPARWYTRAAAPLVPVLQSLWARRCAASLRRLV